MVQPKPGVSLFISAVNCPFFIEYLVDFIGRRKIDRGIETGTRQGATTSVLAQLLPRVDTIEFNLLAFKMSKYNLSDIPNITMHLGESPTILRTLLTEGEENVFIFLDAHGNDRFAPNPIKLELQSIADKKVKPFMIIHDFEPLGLDGYSMGINNMANCKRFFNAIYGVGGFEFYFNSVETYAQLGSFDGPSLYNGTFTDGHVGYPKTKSETGSGVIFISPRNWKEQQ